MRGLIILTAITTLISFILKGFSVITYISAYVMSVSFMIALFQVMGDNGYDKNN